MFHNDTIKNFLKIKKKEVKQNETKRINRK
jgi:hypothetical protein